MIDFIVNNLEYLAIPLVVGGTAFIVKGLITNHSSTPSPSPVAQNIATETTEAITTIKQNMTDVVNSNNEMLDKLKVKTLPNSTINQAIESFKQANINELGVITERLDTLNSTVLQHTLQENILSNPTIDLGFSLCFLGLVTVGVAAIVKYFAK
jgi:hypothetical protein